jgi:hypothetical protein
MYPTSAQAKKEVFDKFKASLGHGKSFSREI